MSNLQAWLASAGSITLVVAAGLIALLLSYLRYFLLRGVRHWWRLRRIQAQISKFQTKNDTTAFRKVFAEDQRLSHLWKEYQESLHIQREERDGQLRTLSVRATVPAELYFNNQFAVDSRLATDFFSHLPGIFTGLGIIGTFYGLITGLSSFPAGSEDASQVRQGLASLMHSVSEAFFVSAAAIGLAIFVTVTERLLLTWLYRQVSQIAHDIDAHFETGAGEEYLARIVKSSEESASQAKILKDALVQELGELLRELTAAQITAVKEQHAHGTERLVQASRDQLEAMRQDSKALGQTIADSIQQSLQGPMQDLASTVRAASGDQSASAVRMLQDVMVSFSQRLNDLFGGQISGLNELNQQTAQSIQAAVATLQTLVANIESTSQRSADAMAQRMAEAVEKIEARQEAINAQTSAFVDQIRQLVAHSQSETSEKLQSTLESIGSHVATMLATLNESQQQAYANNSAREQTMADHTNQVVSSMSASVETLMRELAATTTEMGQSVTSLTQAMLSSTDKMSSGADLLNTATRNFASAGERVSTVMGQAAGVSEKLTVVSGSLTSGATAIQELLKDYRAQRDAVAQLALELRTTVEAARKEASLTSDILERMDSAAGRLSVAQKNADEYLDGVSKVLSEAHGAFATEMTHTLDRANQDFHRKLTEAVRLLSASIEDLQLSLDSLVQKPTGKR